MTFKEKYASCILKYALKHNLNFKTYTETSEGTSGARIYLTNNWGVPDIFVIAELFLIHDKIYYKTSKEKESRGLIKCLKEKFPDKIKRLT